MPRTIWKGAISFGLLHAPVAMYPLQPVGYKRVALKPAELNMAAQLIDSMSTTWDPVQYHDTFRDDIMAMVKKKYDAGEAEQITKVQLEAPEATAGTADLAELLRRSLQGASPRAAKKAAAKSAAPSAARKRATTRHVSKTVH